MWFLPTVLLEILKSTTESAFSEVERTTLFVSSMIQKVASWIGGIS
jgi:hypothetical protein